MNGDKLPNEKARAASEVFAEVLRGVGMPEYFLVAAGQNPDESYEVFSRVNSTTKAAANMLAFTLARMDDEAVAQLLNWLLSQPVIMAKMVAFQSAQMARHAEHLRQQQNATPAVEPAVPDLQGGAAVDPRAIAGAGKKNWTN